MALTINHNLLVAGNPGTTQNSLASGARQLSPEVEGAAGAGAGSLGLRQIIRAEIKPLDSAAAQTPAAGLDAGAAPAQDAAQAIQAPSAPERQTGTLLDMADHMSGLAQSRLSALQGGGFHIPDMSTPDVSSRLRDMGLTNDPLSMDADVASRANEARVGTMIRHGQDMINATARNAEMVSSLFKGTG